jgi:hypothetical protein
MHKILLAPKNIVVLTGIEMEIRTLRFLWLPILIALPSKVRRRFQFSFEKGMEDLRMEAP